MGRTRARVHGAREWDGGGRISVPYCSHDAASGQRERKMIQITHAVGPTSSYNGAIATPKFFTTLALHKCTDWKKNWPTSSDVVVGWGIWQNVKENLRYYSNSLYRSKTLFDEGEFVGDRRGVRRESFQLLAHLHLEALYFFPDCLFLCSVHAIHCCRHTHE